MKEYISYKDVEELLIKKYKNFVSKSMSESLAYYDALEEIRKLDKNVIDESESTWVQSYDGSHYCSSCQRYSTFDYNGNEFLGFFCPNCGKHMTKVIGENKEDIEYSNLS